MLSTPWIIHEAEVALYPAWRDGLPFAGPGGRGAAEPVFHAKSSLAVSESRRPSAASGYAWTGTEPMAEAEWELSLSFPDGVFADDVSRLTSRLAAGGLHVLVARFIDALSGEWSCFRWFYVTLATDESSAMDEVMQRSLRLKSTWFQESVGSSTPPSMDPLVTGEVDWLCGARRVTCLSFDPVTEAWTSLPANELGGGGRYVNLGPVATGSDAVAGLSLFDGAQVYAAVVSGAAGNSITLAQAAAVAGVTTVSVAVSGRAITLTPGAKGSMTVSGTISPNLNSTYACVGVANGYPVFSSMMAEISHSGTHWQIKQGENIRWEAVSSAATPDLVGSWSSVMGASGTVAVAAGLSTHAACVYAVITDAVAGLLVTAPSGGLLPLLPVASDTPTGAPYAATHLTGGSGGPPSDVALAAYCPRVVAGAQVAPSLSVGSIMWQNVVLARVGNHESSYHHGLALLGGIVLQAVGVPEPLLSCPQDRMLDEPVIVFRYLRRIYAAIGHGVFAVPFMSADTVPPFSHDYPFRIGITSDPNPVTGQSGLTLLPEGAFLDGTVIP